MGVPGDISMATSKISKGAADAVVSGKIDGSSRVFTGDFWANLFRDESTKALHSAIEIAFVVLLLVAARIILFRVINRAMELIIHREEGAGREGSAARARTIGGLLKSVTSYALVFIGGFTGLLALGVNAAAVVTTAGVLGLAIGFGAQKLVKDVISGFFILLENQYAVGEYVTIGTYSGLVEDMGMRATWLRDEAGRMIVMSNGDISTVTNHSRGALITSVEVGVAPGTDLDKACEILRDVGSEFARDREGVLAPFTCDGVAAMDGTKITLRLVGEVQPKAQQQVQMDLRRRVRDALVEKDIQIA